VHGGAPKPFGAAAITVALTEKRESSARVALDECVRCGDCATGCNHGAKDSLDVNLLRTAERAGAHIYTGATSCALRSGTSWKTGTASLPPAPGSDRALTGPLRTHGWSTSCTPTRRSGARARGGRSASLRAR